MGKDIVITLDISKDSHFLRFSDAIRNLSKSCEVLILKGKFVEERNWNGRITMIRDSKMTLYPLVQAIKNLPNLRVLDMSQCEDIDYIYDGFSHLNIEKIILPKRVKNLPYFSYCENLKEVVGEGLLEVYGFNDCPNIEKVTYNSNAIRVELNDTKISSIRITKHMTKYSFSNCSNLFEIIIEPGVESLQKGAFANCKVLREIFIPDNVFVEEGVFLNCENLSKVRLPNDLIEIPESLFAGCKSLCKIEGGEKVNKISKHSFLGCDKLNTLPFKLRIEDLNEDYFLSVKENLLGIVLVDYDYNLIWCFDDYTFYHFNGRLDEKFRNRVVKFNSKNNLKIIETAKGIEFDRCPYNNVTEIEIIEEHKDNWSDKGIAINSLLQSPLNKFSSIKSIHDMFKKQVEGLDIEKIIDSYNTYVSESQTVKVGGDNTYHYYKKTSCEYIDAYLETLLPQYNIESHESACHDYTDDMDPEITSKQEILDEDIKRDALKKYSKDEHIIFLIDDYIKKLFASAKLIENNLHIEYAKHVADHFFKNRLYLDYKHNETIGYLCKSNVFECEWEDKIIKKLYSN